MNRSQLFPLSLSLSEEQKFNLREFHEYSEFRINHYTDSYQSLRMPLPALARSLSVSRIEQLWAVQKSICNLKDVGTAWKYICC